MSAGDKPSVYNIDYDGYGNILKLTKPENYRGQRMWHSYTYDDRLHSLVTKVEDAYGYSSSTEYDDLWNAPKTTTDLNGERMEYEYDDLGRPTVIRAPYEIASGEPFTIKYEYEPEKRLAHTIHFSPDGNIDTYTFADSLGRAVQTKRTGSVWNASTKKAEKMSIVSGRVVTDAFGRKITTYYPVAESFADIDKYNRSLGSLQARTEYDSRDRALSVTLADGASTTEVSARFRHGPSTTAATAHSALHLPTAQRLRATTQSYLTTASRCCSRALPMRLAEHQRATPTRRVATAKPFSTARARMLSLSTTTTL